MQGGGLEQKKDASGKIQRKPAAELITPYQSEFLGFHSTLWLRKMFTTTQKNQKKKGVGVCVGHTRTRSRAHGCRSASKCAGVGEGREGEGGETGSCCLRHLAEHGV